MGAHWTHSFGARILNAEVSNPITIYLSDDRNLIERFDREHSVLGRYVSTNELGSVLYRDAGGFRLERSGGEVLQFDEDGRLIAIQQLDNPIADQVLLYQGDRLTHVVDGLGRQMIFAYQDEQLSSVSFPDGTSVAFAYTAAGDLSTVDRFDADGAFISRREYVYENPALPGHVTGIINEGGTRLSTYAYDQFGRVLSSQHAGGANSVTIEYPTQSNGFSAGERRVVINGVETRDYDFFPGGPWAGVRRLQALETNVDPSIPGSGEVVSRDYDSQQRLTRKVDPDGNETTYSYDALGRVTERVEAAGQPEERRIVQGWNASINRMSARELFDSAGQQHQQRTFAYDAIGRLIAECLHDFDEPAAANYACGSAANAPSGVRQTRYLRCTTANLGVAPHFCPVEGALRALDGPRTDVVDRTEFVYHASDAAGCSSGTGCTHLQGDLAQVINALGHTVQYLEYDGAGRPLRVLDENGVERVLAYHPRGWLASESVNGVHTHYSYFEDGSLASVTRADGSSLSFEYDQARRLTAVEDALGGRMEFTLNAAGQRVEEVIKDATATLKFRVERHFDDFQRLERLVDGLGFETTFDYDKLGNQREVIDPLLNPTLASHDAHSRVRITTDALAAATTIEYNIRNQVTAVTDAEGLTTTYTYNNLGDLVELNSPDTGITTFVHDQAGNQAQRTDARGVTALYEYDALNRLTLIDYPDDAQNIAFSYDDPAAGLTACTTSYSVGHLTQMTDSSGTTQWCYDALGNTTKRYQAHTGHSLGYNYDAFGRLNRIDYPSGRTVTYTRNVNGDVTDVLVGSTQGQRPLPFVSDVRRAPFGPIERIDFASGRSIDYQLDLNYQIIEVDGDGLALRFDRDPVGNILDLLSPGTQAVIEQYGYDDVYRLTSVADATSAPIESFTYDLIGNRQSATNASGTTSYGYAPGSHRLTAVGADDRTFDAMGNTVSRGSGASTFSYDDRGRLIAVQMPGIGGGTTASYVINGMGQRVRKTVQSLRGTQATYFIYDEAGRLMGEYKPARMGLGLDPWREYIWLDDRVVGVFDGAGAVYEVYTDHLGTPCQATPTSTQ